MKTNLLPLQAKAELYQEEIKKLIMIFGVLILIFLFSLTLILFEIKDYISRQVDSERIFSDSEKKQLQISEIQNLREKINLANKTLSQLDSFYQEEVSLIEIFEKISNTIPPQIYLTNLFYQKDNSQISLSGFSPQREILVEFKKNLEKEFLEVYFPPQVWTKSTDIDFQVNFKIKK